MSNDDHNDSIVELASTILFVWCKSSVVYVYVRLYVHLCVCMCLCVCLCVCTCVCVCVCVYCVM